MSRIDFEEDALLGEMRRALAGMSEDGLRDKVTRSAFYETELGAAHRVELQTSHVTHYRRWDEEALRREQLRRKAFGRSP